VVQFGSYLGPLVFLLGFLLNFTGLAWAGVFLFAGVAVFALITLPVEFDASRRAKELLASQGYAWGEELTGVSRVLDAAALTYVAGLVQALSTLLYYVFLLTGFRRRE
jgi:Zn-dependent membrane protease YugP